jgi:hypothetical protein
VFIRKSSSVIRWVARFDGPFGFGAQILRQGQPQGGEGTDLQKLPPRMAAAAKACAVARRAGQEIKHEADPA